MFLEKKSPFHAFTPDWLRYMDGLTLSQLSTIKHQSPEEVAVFAKNYFFFSSPVV